MRRSIIAISWALAAPAFAQVAAPAPPALERRASGLFEGLEQRAPAATAASGAAVVTSADVRASQAGADMLRRGGTAADAAIATAVALTVVEPQSSGLGGGAFALAHDARTGRLLSLDGREQAPASARPDRFMAGGKPMGVDDAQWGGRSVGVPGLVAMAWELHRAQGKLPWATLFEPAIRLARDGMVIGPRLARTLEDRRARVAASGLSAVFLRPDGTVRTGERVAQPDLAATLEAIARGGRDAFYAGPIAESIARAVTDAPRGPAPMTAADLAAYRVVARAPVCGAYRGWRVCSMAPPSAGGTALLQILSALEPHDMARLGKDSPLAWHAFAEATRLAMADRAAYAGDPGFVAVPTDGLLDPGYLRSRAALVRLDRRIPAVAAGTPPGTRAAIAAATGPEAGTSHLAAADAAGNVVSLTSTIETIFGSGQTAAGFFLNNQLTDFDFLAVRADGSPAPNRVEAGKRPRSSMAPTILYAPDGRVFGAVGAAGGSTIIAQVAKTVVGIIDWKLPVEQATALPVVFAQGDAFAYEAAMPAAMAAAWSALGHRPRVVGLPIKTNALVRAGGGWRGAGDPRSEGQAVGVVGGRVGGRR